MKNHKKIFLAAGVLALSTLGSACAPTVRFLTAESWYDDGKAYITYWASTGGRKGESKVELCHIAENNSLGCANQAEAEAALNVRGRGKGKTASSKSTPEAEAPKE